MHEECTKGDRARQSASGKTNYPKGLIHVPLQVSPLGQEGDTSVSTRATWGLLSRNYANGAKIAVTSGYKSSRSFRDTKKIDRDKKTIGDKNITETKDCQSKTEGYR